MIPVFAPTLFMPGGAGTPLTIFGANLLAWYNANTGVTAGGTLGANAWADQSGNGRNLGLGSFQVGARIVTNFNVSKNGLQFLQSDTDPGFKSTNFNLGTNKISFWVVGTFSASNVGRVVFYMDDSSGDDTTTAAAISTFGSTAPNVDIMQNSVVSNDAALGTGSPIRFGAVYDGTNTTGTIYLNNSANTPFTTFGNNTLGTATSSIFLGSSRIAFTSNWDMTIAEVVVTNNVPSSAQRSSLDTYFKSTWGL